MEQSRTRSAVSFSLDEIYIRILIIFERSKGMSTDSKANIETHNDNFRYMGFRTARAQIMFNDNLHDQLCPSGAVFTNSKYGGWQWFQ